MAAPTRIVRPASATSIRAPGSRLTASSRCRWGIGLRRPPAVHEQPDLVAAEDLLEPAEMVLVGMGEHHDVDSTVVERERLARSGGG